MSSQFLRQNVFSGQNRHQPGFVSATAVRNTKAEGSDISTYKERTRKMRTGVLPELRMELKSSRVKTTESGIVMLILSGKVIELEEVIKNIQSGENEYLKGRIAEDGRSLYLPVRDVTESKDDKGEKIPGKYIDSHTPLLIRNGSSITLSKVQAKNVPKAFDTVKLINVCEQNRKITDKTSAAVKQKGIDSSKFYKNFDNVINYMPSNDTSQQIARMLPRANMTQFLSQRFMRALNVFFQDDRRFIEPVYQGMTKMDEVPSYMIATGLMYGTYWDDEKIGGRPCRIPYRIEMVRAISKVQAKPAGAAAGSSAPTQAAKVSWDSTKTLIDKARDNARINVLDSDGAQVTLGSYKKTLGFFVNARQMLHKDRPEFLRILLDCNVFDEEYLSSFGIVNPITFMDIVGTHDLCCACLVTPMVEETLEMSTSTSVPHIREVKQLREQFFGTGNGDIDPFEQEHETEEAKQNLLDYNVQLAEMICKMRGAFGLHNEDEHPIEEDLDSEEVQTDHDITLAVKATGMVNDIRTWVMERGLKLENKAHVIEYLVKCCTSRDMRIQYLSGVDASKLADAKPDKLLDTFLQGKVRDDILEGKAAVVTTSGFHKGHPLNDASIAGKQPSNIYNLSEWQGDTSIFFKEVTLEYMAEDDDEEGNGEQQKPASEDEKEEASAEQDEQEDGDNEDEEEEEEIMPTVGGKRKATTALTVGATAAAKQRKLQTVKVTLQPYEFYLLAGRDEYNTSRYIDADQIDTNPLDILLGRGAFKKAESCPSRVVFAVPSEKYLNAHRLAAKHAKQQAASPQQQT